MVALQLQQEGQTIKLTGALTVNNVTTIRVQALQCIKTMSTVTIDLKEVIYTDSAGLVLLLEWLRSAQTLQKTLLFLHIPDQLRALAYVSGVEKFFGLQVNG